MSDDLNDDVSTQGDKQYQFDFSADGTQVTAFYEYEDGVLEQEDIGAKDVFTVTEGTVTHTRTKPFGSEVKVYQDTDGDGYYERVSEQWIGSATPPTNNPVPALAHVLRYLPTDGDDFIAVRVGGGGTGGLGADQFVVKEAGNLRIEDFDRDEGDKLVFDTGLGLANKEQLMSYITQVTQDGDNLVVEFGSAATITLVGITLSEIGWDDVFVYT